MGYEESQSLGCISVNDVGPWVRYYESMDNVKLLNTFDAYPLQGVPKIKRYEDKVMPSIVLTG